MWIRLQLTVLISIISPVLLFCQAKADSSRISFNSVSKDFGIVYEADSAFSVSFEYTNTGKQVLKISRIYAPGFTFQEHQFDSVLAGQSSLLTFKISPKGHAGNYYKKIKVFSNAVNSPNDLEIKGKIVTGSQNSSYKYTVGPLSFKQSQINFGYVYKGTTVTRCCPVSNSSKEPVIVSFDSVPEFISISPVCDTLKPGENAIYEFKFDGAICSEWDFYIQKIYAKINSKIQSDGFLNMVANIREDFSSLSEEEKMTKPIASFPVQVFNFDTISMGKIVKNDFVLLNTGKRDIIIRAVKPTCGCTAALPEKTIVPPGSSTLIHVEFNSESFLGENKKGVSIITNDPENYKQFLWITGFVKQ
jgi:hypothetical protein